MSLDDFARWLDERAAQADADIRAAEQPDADTELAAWEKFALNKLRKSHNRAFEPVHTRGDLADFITEALSDKTTPDGVKAVFTEARERLAHKAIQATRLEFEEAFSDILAEARAGNINRRRWAQLVRSLIKRWGTQAYRDGVEDGGADPDELTDDDRQRINELIADQSQYVTRFGAELFKAITDAEAAQKPAMWFNRSIMPFYDAGKLSADRNGMYEWVLGRTEEHCRTCLAANGQRHRLKSWHNRGVLPQNNGHAELFCHGFNCDCRLVRVRGRARGRLDRIPTES